MRSLALFILIALSYHTAFGQHTLEGSVYDRTTGDPLVGASVVLDDQTGTVADQLGGFRLAVDSGSHNLRVSFVGYQPVTKSINPSGLDAPIMIPLEPGDLRLADVTVTAEEAILRQSIADYDIQLQPIRTSQDVLRQVPGLFIAQHAGGGKAEQIFLRGFDIDHGTDINLSVDGLPVNMVSHAHGQGYADLHFVIPETIRRVNFGLGPHDASRGDFATAGFAAFETKDRLEQSSVKIEGGQFGTARTVAMINLVNSHTDRKREDGYLAGEIFRSDGYFESPQNFLRLNLMGKYNLLLNDRTRFSAGFSTFGSRWDASGQIPLRAVRSGQISRFGAIDDTEGGNTRRTNVNLRLIRSIGQTGTFSNQLYVSRYDFDLFSNFTFFLNDSVRGDQIHQSEKRTIYGYRGTYNLNHRMFGREGLSELGGSIRYDDIRDVRLSRTQNRTTRLRDLSRGDVGQANASVWFRHTLSVTHNLSVTGGLRYDYFSFLYEDALAVSPSEKTQTQGLWSPKFNVDYQLNDRIRLLAKASTGFHSNDARVVVAQQGREVLPRAYGLDIGSILKPLPNLLINTTVWWLNLDQEFVYVGDEGIVEPGGKTRRRGIDLSVRYQPKPWLYLDANLNMTDPKALNTPEGQHYIPLAPVVTSSGGVGLQLNNGIDARINYRFLGDRPANEDYSLTADGYFLVDAKATYSLSRYEFGLTVENIFNQEWKEAQFETESRLQDESEPVSEIHFTPGNPFFLRASLKVNFGSN